MRALGDGGALMTRVTGDPPEARFARTTIASAFQRTSAESRDSISRLPW